MGAYEEAREAIDATIREWFRNYCSSVWVVPRPFADDPRDRELHRKLCTKCSCYGSKFCPVDAVVQVIIELNFGPYTLKEIIELASQVKEGQRLAAVEKNGELPPKQFRKLIHCTVCKSNKCDLDCVPSYTYREMLAAGFVKEVKK